MRSTNKWETSKPMLASDAAELISSIKPLVSLGPRAQRSVRKWLVLWQGTSQGLKGGQVEVELERSPEKKGKSQGNKEATSF